MIANHNIVFPGLNYYSPIILSRHAAKFNNDIVIATNIPQSTDVREECEVGTRV